MTDAEYFKEVADRVRPSLNIYWDGTIRVSHGQEDIAETVVRLVESAMEECGWRVFLPPGSARFTA